MCAYIQNSGDRFQDREKKLGRCILKFFPYRPVHSSVFHSRRDPQSANKNEIAAGRDYGEIQYSIKLPVFRTPILIIFFSSGDATGSVDDEIRQYNNNRARNRDFSKKGVIFLVNI